MGDSTWYKTYKPKSAADAEWFEGMCCRYGYDREIDHAQAFAHFLKSVEMGYAGSFEMVIESYRCGRGVAEDPTAANDWAARRFAREAGFDDWREWTDERYQQYSAEQKWRSQFTKRPIARKKP